MEYIFLHDIYAHCRNEDVILSIKNILVNLTDYTRFYLKSVFVPKNENYNKFRLKTEWYDTTK